MLSTCSLAYQLYFPGFKSEPECEIRSGTYAIGLISWAASEGSTVSSLICDRWLTRKLATFMGSTNLLDSANVTFGCGCGLDLRTQLTRWGLARVRCSACRARVVLCSASAVLRLRTQSRHQLSSTGFFAD